MKLFLLYFFVFVISFPNIAIAQSCISANDCNSKGTVFYNQGKYKKAIKLFIKQADLATGKEDKNNLRVALNNLALANLKLGNVLLANAWIQVAKEYYTDDKITLFNYALITKQLNKINKPLAITGRYSRYAGYGEWSNLEIKELKKGIFKVHLYLQRYGVIESAEESGPAAYWDLYADGYLDGDNLIIKYKGLNEKDCAITMEKENIKFVAPRHNLNEECETGGYNTYVDGTYWLTDTREPIIKISE
jgi:hypothetical protein